MPTSLFALRRCSMFVVVTALITGLINSTPAAAINDQRHTQSKADYLSPTESPSNAGNFISKTSRVSPSPAPNAAASPMGYPGSPQSFAVTRGSNLVKLTWKAPQNSGEPSVTSYAISASLKGKVVKSIIVRGNVTTATITGLLNGLSYVVSIWAKNSVGLTPVAKTQSIIPSKIAPKVPDAPIVTLVNLGSRTASLTYKLGSNNGSTITKVEYSVNSTTIWNMSDSTLLTITNVPNGMEHTVRIRAVNSMGKSRVAMEGVTPIAYTNSINFTQPVSMSTGQENQPLVAQATGGTTIFASQTPNVCSVAYGAIHAIAVGTCTILASNTGNLYFAAAQSVSQSVEIAKGTTPTPTPTPTPTESAAELLWSQEFNGSSSDSLSTSVWDVNIGDGCSAPYYNCGWGNGEKQYYVANANKLDGLGNLVITTKRTDPNAPVSCYYGRCSWTSGKITTQDKVVFSYGYVEARIQTTAGGGTWPAFWMLGNDIKTNPWPACGEIDIMESEGNAAYTNWMTIHRPGSVGGGNSPIGSTKRFNNKLSDDFHTFGIMWTPAAIEWRIDGVTYFTAYRSSVGSAPWPFGENGGKSPKFYVIANLAMGGNMGGTIDANLQTDSMKIDWIRYSKVGGYGTVTYLP